MAKKPLTNLYEMNSTHVYPPFHLSQDIVKIKMHQLVPFYDKITTFVNEQNDNRKYALLLRLKLKIKTPINLAKMKILTYR